MRAGLELVASVSGSQDARSPADTCRYCDGNGGRRRLDRIRGRGIVGETPNLAARLQGIAEPTWCVIAESTRKLLGNLFEFQGPWSKGPQGYRRAGTGLRCTALEFG